MTVAEKKAYAEAALKDLKQGGYIKGYGANMFRQMDDNHNPLRNLTRDSFEMLKFSGLIEQAGLLWKPTEKVHKVISL